MNLIEVEEKEYIKYAYKHPNISFYQTPNWGKFKNNYGWQLSYVLLKDVNKVIGGTMLLAKKVPKINKYIFYTPRGFLIDYNDQAVLENFTKEIKKYIKKQKGIFVKIDPNIIHLERNGNYEVIPNGIDNSNVIKNLKSLGYKFHGFTTGFIGRGSTQARWAYRIDLKDRTIDEIHDNFNTTTKQLLRKDKHIIIRELNENELNIFYEMMEHTCKRQRFDYRGSDFFQKMYDELIAGNMIKVMVAELDVDNYLQELDKKDDKYLELKKLKTKKLILATAWFITFGNEVYYHSAGSYREYMKYNGQYILQWEMIKYAKKEGYHYYNLGGIGGINDKNDPHYGLWYFKNNFRGEVVEYIGEFDLIINKPLYWLYNLTYDFYMKWHNKK